MNSNTGLTDKIPAGQHEHSRKASGKAAEAGDRGGLGVQEQTY